MNLIKRLENKEVAIEVKDYHDMVEVLTKLDEFGFFFGNEYKIKEALSDKEFINTMRLIYKALDGSLYITYSDRVDNPKSVGISDGKDIEEKPSLTVITFEDFSKEVS